MNVHKYKIYHALYFPDTQLVISTKFPPAFDAYQISEQILKWKSHNTVDFPNFNTNSMDKRQLFECEMIVSNLSQPDNSWSKNRPRSGDGL